jgi:hypothetical protein
MFHLEHENATPEVDRDRRFTLDRTLDLIAEKYGHRWDLDVCAEELAHVCARYYSLERGQNGLILPWHGDVWCNPPWSELYRWTARAWDLWHRGACNTITMLIPVRTEQPFWQQLVEPYRDRANSPLSVWFMPKRQEFGSPSDPKKLIKGSPPFICCVLHWSPPGTK